MVDSATSRRGAGAVRLSAVLASLAWLLAACAPTSEPVLQPPTQPVVPWTAAIGELHVGPNDPHCSAVLVARDMIVTASHCLYMKNARAPVRPTDIEFRPNLGALPTLPPARGIEFKAYGRLLRGGRLRNEDVPHDWVLIKISPPVTRVQPLPVAALPISGMLQLVQSGDRLVTAGYGNGAYEELRLHSPCRIIPQSELGMYPDDAMVITSCIFRVGDSGGAILLVDGAGQPALVGIIAGFGRKPKSTEPLGLGVNASNFQRFIGGPVAERPDPTPGTEEAALY